MSAEPHDDRWHYMDYRDGKHDGNYIEWKYFNFVQPGCAGYIIYYLMDPEKGTGMGGGRVVVRVFKDGEMHGALQHIDMDRVSLEAVSAGITMGDSSLAEIDEHHYRIAGSIDDASWQLDFTQKAPVIESFSNIRPGIFPWERMNWLIKMPCARVEGTIRVGDKDFAIQALGYSDTNWGELMPFFSRYEWGQYNDEIFSLVFGIVYRLGRIKNAYVYCTIDGKTIALERATAQVRHTAWKRDALSAVKTPSATEFVFTQDEYSIRISSSLISADTMGLVFRSWLPKAIVSEQLVQYEGTVLQHGKIVHTFSGKGFQEWSTKTWKKVPVSF